MSESPHNPLKNQLQALIKKPLFKSSLRFLFAVLAGILVCQFNLVSLESYLYDFRVRFRPSPGPSNKVAIVLTDKNSVESLKKIPDFEIHTQLVEKLKSLQPSAIVYVTALEKVTGTSEQKVAFAKLSAETESFYQVTDTLAMKGEEKDLKLAKELGIVPLASGPRTADTKSFAKDGVTRRMLYNYQEQLLLHPLLAAKFNPDVLEKSKVRGLFPWIDSDQLFIDFKKPGSYLTVKTEDVLSGQIPLSALKDRLVLVGDHLQLDPKDYVQTPFSRSIDGMPLVELHANMFETLIQNSAPQKAPPWINYLFTILVSILTVHVALTVKPFRGIVTLVSTAAIFTAVSYFAFWPFGIWIEMAHPFLAIFLCYYFFIPYRLIVENRRSWEYYQKHKLLSEVEELKTNFIGMMSHDLKTPLARIHGMTEVIQKDSTPLSTPQREALDMIRQSSDDLTKFISTILNYAKIESQGIELHKQSKDINQLLKEVAKKHEFLAKLKHIQLITELEPLFSIKVDPELLKQVFSNLVENAIKYSPENSKVLITSEEVDGKIVVQVADQGAGIPADELPNVFMKFFRSKDAKSSPIKGSGLGLYLAKYFVELHQGRIYCESSPGAGSTFTVELPVSN